jgi:hypothetical protein
MIIAQGLPTGGHRYLGSQLEDPISALECVLTDWYFNGIAPPIVVISTGYGVSAGSIHGTTAYGLSTGGHRYLGSQLEDPITALDVVLADWYFAGWDSADFVSSRISEEFGIVGGSIPGNITIQGAVISMECGIAVGAVAGVDYAHAFGLKTGGDRYPYSQLEDPIAVLDAVLTDWYLRRWDRTSFAPVVSTAFGIVAGSASVVGTSAAIHTTFGIIGGSFTIGTTIQGAVISTVFQVTVAALIIDQVYVTLTEESDVVCAVAEDAGASMEGTE